MVESDLDQVIAIEQTCFRSGWNKEQFRYELNDNMYAYLYTLYEDEKVIGYIDFWITFEICQLAKIAVDNRYRGLGNAAIMMDKMLAIANRKKCDNVSLEVRTSNMAAQYLYEKYEFINVNTRKNYYSDNGEDAFVMVKALGGVWE